MISSSLNNGRPILGIDPGFNGGLSFLYPDTMDVVPFVTPTVKAGKTALDKSEIIRIITEQNPILIVIEKVGAMPGQGVTSMFSFGYWAGFFEGVATGLGIPMVFVPPQTWMKEVLVGQPKGEKASIQFCQRLWPKVEWRKSERCRTPHDGKTDSACIALYGYRKFKAESKI